MKELLKEYNKRKKEIQARLREFEQVKGEGVFYELCFCLLTPQSSAKKCFEAVNELQKVNFFEKGIGREKIEKILQKKTRFYKNKSRYLIDCKNNFGKIREMINDEIGSKILREYLVKNIKGIGHKEASHFLRNTGHKNLAILDRHILKNLVKYVIINEIPKNLNKKDYLEIEDKFKKFSQKIKIPLDELDLLFWAMETGEVFR